MTRRLIIAACLLASVLKGPGVHASVPEPADAPPPLRVAVSVPPLAWFVEALGGDAVDVVTALPPGASPATFDPTPRSLARLADCRLLVCVGVPMERALAPALSAIVPGMTVVDVAAGVADVELAHHDHHGHDHGGPGALDPHVWLSPRRAPRLLANTATALAAVRPDLAARIEAALPALEAEFAALDRELAGLLRDADRPVVVHHPSFGYLTADYGLRTLVVERAGLSPTPRHLARVMDEITATDAAGLVVQPQFADGRTLAAAEALGLPVVEVDPLAGDLPANLRRMAAVLADLAGSEGRTP